MDTARQLESDEDLARACQRGSLPAFEELVRRYEARVYAFVLQSLRNEADAADLTQESFVRAFQAIAQFDGKHSFAGWLFAIARRKCIDRFRAARPVYESHVESVDEEDPARLLAEREDHQSLWSLARRRLPELQFHALWLRYAEDMGVEEIAAVLKKTQSHVKVLLFRARQALGAELERAEARGGSRAALKDKPQVHRKREDWEMVKSVHARQALEEL